MILVLSDLWSPFPGGAERLIFNVGRHLYRRGMDVHVVTGYAAAQRFDGPPVQVMAIPTGPDRDEGGAMVAALLASAAPSVILTHHYYASQFRDELVASGIPLVQIMLNGHRIPEAALAVYISSWVRDQCGGAQPQDMVITPPAFDDVVSATHGPAIGFIKPLPHKGADLVYAIARAMPGRRFVILRGEWQDLETIRRLRNVEFLEPVDDIRDFYSRCRIILMPSRSEDAGTCAQEATLNGLPCISTNVGGLAETNAAGVLLPVEAQAPAWAKAIRSLDDPGRYAAVVASQRAHLASVDHAGALDDLAGRIAALTR